MTARVIGTDGPLCALLADAPAGLVVVALPPTAGPVGALPTEELAHLIDVMLLPAFGALREAADDHLRTVVVCPASACVPDHRDGARSVVGAGVAMLAAAASASHTVNVVAAADDTPIEEVAATVRFLLSDVAPSLNGAIIRMDGGRDAVLSADTRAEGD